MNGVAAVIGINGSVRLSGDTEQDFHANKDFPRANMINLGVQVKYAGGWGWNKTNHSPE